MSSQSSHHPHEVLLAQFSLYVHKGGLKPDSFHLVYMELPVFIFMTLASHQFSSRLHHPGRPGIKTVLSSDWWIRDHVSIIKKNNLNRSVKPEPGPLYAHFMHKCTFLILMKTIKSMNCSQNSDLNTNGMT